MPRAAAKSRIIPDEKLVPYALVSFKTAYYGRRGWGKIVAVSPAASGKPTRYTVRIQEYTADEHTRRLLRSEITAVLKGVPASR